MQLKNYRSIKAQLTVATCSLLATSPVFAESNTPFEITLSSMLYSEEGRVFVNEDVLQLRKEINDEEFVTARYIFDTMSGPSPNGLPKLESAQTITSPSGSTTTSSGSEEPTFEFRDTRHALNLEWKKPLSRLLSTTNSVSISSEYDYLSVGGSTSWSYEINNRLTTLNSGIGGNYDQISPVGGTPQPLGQASSEKNLPDQDKGEVNALLGVTQILDRQTLLQANFTVGYGKGYLTDPYKLIGYLDNNLEPVSGNPYFYEKRPNTRLSQAVYFQVIRDFDGDVLRAGYRFYSDDWDVQSHTYELKYSFTIADENELQLHYRYYTQSAAEFYHYFLVNQQTNGVSNNDVVTSIDQLDYASADYRLGNLTSETMGVKYSHHLPYRDSELDFRVDRVVQQDRKNKFSDVKIWIAQIVFKFLF